MKRRNDALDNRIKRRRLARKLRVFAYFFVQKTNRDTLKTMTFIQKEVLKKRKKALNDAKKEKKRKERETKGIITRLVNDMCKIVEKKCKPVSTPKSRIMSRKYDTAKHVELHILDTVEKQNIPFDKEAEEKKKEIWGYEWEQTCVWTGQKSHLSVDHMYPIRGAYGNKSSLKTGWINKGLRGSDSQWNTIMVYKTKNAGFKIFNHQKTHGWKKDVSWQKLTTQELEQCTEQEKDFYTKLQAWRAYTMRRGASFCWQFEKNTNEQIEKLYCDIYKQLEKCASELVVSIVAPERVHSRLMTEI
tara:strand:- start:2205 stop:3110 length:906 start_codon:yes stop_codon:yes gene_type:complete